MRHALFAALLAAAPVSAATCPEAPDHSGTLAQLVDEVRAAPDEQTARLLSNRMWQLWAEAPDRAAQDLLDAGMERRDVADFEGAAKAFDALVAYCPDYAEGYNQRAFANYLRGEHRAALPDLQRARALSPQHTGVLTGLALTLMALERRGEAVLVLREALEINPWLSERHLLPALEAGEQEL